MPEGESGDSKNARLIFNVGGHRHETFISTLKAIPGSRLNWIAENYLLLQHSPAFDPKKKEFFFDRNPTCFAAILNYFRTGQLHYPTDICGPMFEIELKFWGVDEKQMESCCWEGYTANRDKNDKLKGFKGPAFQTDDESDHLSEHKSKWRRLRMKVWRFVDDPFSSKPARVHALLRSLLLFVYILLPIIWSTNSIRTASALVKFCLKITENIINAYFTTELIIRGSLCPDKREFAKDQMNWVDMISLIPIYLELAINDKRISYYTDILAVFRIVKVFRSFRYNYALQVLVNTLKESLPELMLLVFLMTLLATMFAFVNYFVESRENDSLFQSIPHALWWAFITMTTVGYGDMYPNSGLGKILGIMCAICGLLMVALPVSVVATNFSIYYSYAKARIKLPPKMKVKPGTDANNFLGTSTNASGSKDSGKPVGAAGKGNKVSPEQNGSASNGKAKLNGAPVGPRGNKLPPLKKGKSQVKSGSKWYLVKDAIEKMKEQGIIKPKKMDIATIVFALSSKGDWEAPSG